MKKADDTRRVQRVEKEIQAVVGMYLISGFSEPLDVFVTLTRTLLSADLKSGKIYFTALDKDDSSQSLDEKTLQETEKILNDHVHEFQQHIAKELKLRFTPKIKFFYDQSVEKIRKVDQLLSQLSASSKNSNKITNE